MVGKAPGRYQVAAGIGLVGAGMGRGAGIGGACWDDEACWDDAGGAKVGTGEEVLGAGPDAAWL